MQIRLLWALTVIVAIMVAIDAAWTFVILAMVQFSPGMFAQIQQAAESIDAAQMGFTICTMIMFAVWIWVAGNNLVRAGFDDLEFTPASRIWWFAIPIACLFKPFQGMRELWNASHGNISYEENHTLIGAWWALWLASAFSNYLSSMSLAMFWVSACLAGAAAVAAIVMISGIARAQTRFTPEALEEVFA